MSREIEVTVREGDLFDADFNKVLARLAILLLADLSGAKRGFKIVPVPKPREDGPFHQLQVVSDGETVLFSCEGDTEDQLADSLWAAVCEKYVLCERKGLLSQARNGPLN